MGAVDGIVVVDKPVGWSSMDVVRKVRGALGRSVGRPAGGGKRWKVGHAGTLDPLASGVVVVCIGKATAKVAEVMGQTKVYEAAVDLSAFTATDDREAPPEVVALDGPPPDAARVRAALGRFEGEVTQTPPAFSAVHVEGRRAYELARQGREVALAARVVRIDAVDLLDYAWPIATLRVTCGKGTYIRSLARDLGVALGTGGHLAALRRTAVGPYMVKDAVPGERLLEGFDAAWLR